MPRAEIELIHIDRMIVPEALKRAVGRVRCVDLIAKFEPLAELDRGDQLSELEMPRLAWLTP
jgi:hypothetical protein